LEADAEHHERLAKAFEIVSSLADWLDEDCGIGSGDDLCAFLDSSGILRILSPEHVSSAASVAGRQPCLGIVNDKEADESKLSRLGVAEADEVRSDKFTIVPNGALLDQAAGVNHVPVFEPRPSLRGVEERESAVAVESTPGTLASLNDAPHDLGSHMNGHLENYYLPPDECYDSLDDDKV
jgi:hypothetical protein